MFAVPSGSPRASADLNVQVADGTSGQGTDGPDGSDEAHGPPAPAGTDFGPNQWLVDELYQRYQADPSSVDRAWWNFFADYQPQPADAAQAAPAAPAGLTPPARPAPAPPA